jgi:polar amino acid transport system ATP-binding protein
VIETFELTKRFETRTVLDKVSVQFERGTVTAIVGPSGGGKSTLLRCLNGLERVDQGHVRIGDLELGPQGEKGAREERATLRAMRLRAGMVFQSYGLFPHMTALGNVMEAPVHVKKVAPDHARERAEALLDKVGLTARRDAFPRELSGGEQQRVAIARALAMEPEALLLDEPTSALDPDRKLALAKVLERLAREGTSVVVVTHEAAVLRGVCDRAVLLREGRVIACGTPAEVLDHGPRAAADVEPAGEPGRAQLDKAY